MKTLLLLSALVLASCTTTTTFHADGSKTVVKDVNVPALAIGANLATATLSATISNK